jgi:hypothetical protein
MFANWGYARCRLEEFHRFEHAVSPDAVALRPKLASIK